MNQNHKYLTFRIHNLLYGINAVLVQEIFPLPELIPITGANTDVIGVFSLKKQIIPVIHLDLLWGASLLNFHINDYVIIVLWEGLQIGIVVHEIYEMLELDIDVIETPASHGIASTDISFIDGVIKIETEMVLLLDSQKIIRQPDALLTLIWDAESKLDFMASSVNEQNCKEVDKQLEGIQVTSFYDLYCPNATIEEKAIFQQRAFYLNEGLENSEENSETEQFISLAVIGFGNECFGLDLELVREFTSVDNLKPIPCCPKHIVGNMNLRGEIVTLVDIRNVLNLPITPIDIDSKVVVVQVDDIVVGLPVDRVLEVVYLDRVDITPLAATVTNNGTQYLRGIAPFEEKMLYVLDLPKILLKSGLVVNDEVEWNETHFR